MPFRILDVDGLEYQYKIGKKNVEIRPPEGQKQCPLRTEINAATVAALMPEQLEADPSLADQVTPGQIVAYIRTHFPAKKA